MRRNGVQLVGEDRLGVVQEAAHQSGLAVVDRSGGGEAEKSGGQGCFQLGGQE